MKQFLAPHNISCFPARILSKFSLVSFLLPNMTLLDDVRRAATSEDSELKARLIGTSLHDAPVPSAVLDLSIVKQNCQTMLESAKRLQFSWRAHVKTHKTRELTALQVGDGHGSLNVIVSTIAEAWHIYSPLCQAASNYNRDVSLLFGVPIIPSYVKGLAQLSDALGPGILAILVDHPGQLKYVAQLFELSKNAPEVFIKLDCGGSRSGVPPDFLPFQSLVSKLDELADQGICSIKGLYAHAGHSYAGTTSAAALQMLNTELLTLLRAVQGTQSADFSDSMPSFAPKPRNWTLSVGATPTVTSARLAMDASSLNPEDHGTYTAFRHTCDAITALGCTIELHAGVYTTLDLQQLATHALPAPHLTFANLGLTILTEVASLYTHRAQPEALVAAGSIALGREPCPAYPGWGIVTPWNRSGESLPTDVDLSKYEGWIVGKVSQEHGILRYTGEAAGTSEDGKKLEGLEIGQRVRIWPNHACIAGTGFEYYLVVDGGDEIVDVWARCSGWT
jgi:D-serine deaminase-like pyridoxal phosphate-dependent protein